MRAAVAARPLSLTFTRTQAGDGPWKVVGLTPISAFALLPDYGWVICPL